MRRIFVHGFTQTARSWERVLALLPEDDGSLALDVPTGMDFNATADALGRAGGQGTYVGYSMGGRLCLRIALERPDLVDALVLVSASPGIADPVQRERRRMTDELQARRIERDGAGAFLEDWLSGPLFHTLTGEARGLEWRQRDVSVLMHQVLTLGQGAMEPLWDRLGELRLPVTLIVGSRDTAYIGHAQRMRSAITASRLVIVEGVGHAVPFEDPGAFVRDLTR